MTEKSIPTHRRTEIYKQHSSIETPLPSPEVLAGYEQVVSGAANTIIEWATEEQKHRHNLQRGRLASEKYVVTISVVAAVTVVLILSILIAVAAYFHSTEGVIAGALSAVGSIVGLFLQLGKSAVKT